METKFTDYVILSSQRIAMPIGVYAGLEMISASVRDAVTNPQAQFDAQMALHKRYQTAVLLTAMDLSAEAETFGSLIRMTDDEIPTVINRQATSLEQIQSLRDPQPGDMRTGVHLEAARMLASYAEEMPGPRKQAGWSRPPVLGGLIGPFSLAGRLFGVSEALELTLNEPETMAILLQKTTRFLTAYARAFRDVGADGLIMAEPAAGLLSPKGMAQFSSSYIKQIVEAVQTEAFTVVLHNCGARLAHLPRVLEAGASIFHFGAPMDLLAALDSVQDGVILAGNLDPTAVFHNGTPEDVYSQTAKLLAATAGKPAYVISSGCDLPPGTPLANLDAFYRAVTQYNAG